MDTDPPKRKLLLVAFLAVLLLGWGIIIPNKVENNTDKQIERKDSEKTRGSDLIVIQGNTFIAVVPPATPKVQVLGILSADSNLSVKEAELLNKLWFCEASFRHTGIWGDAGRAYGAFQFWQPTWDLYCEGSRENFDDQVKCASYMIFDLGEGRRHWRNCWRKMNLEIKIY